MSKKIVRAFSVLFLVSFVFQLTVFSQKTNSPITPRRYARLVIRNAMIVDGSGKPASGLYDIVVENDLITQIAALDPVAVKEGNAKRVAVGEVEIDASADRPGLGIEFDREAAKKHPFQPAELPQLRRLDGSFTNW